MDPGALELFVDVLVVAGSLTLTLSVLRYVSVGTLSFFGWFDPKWAKKALLIPWRGAALRWALFGLWIERHFRMQDQQTAHFTSLLTTCAMTYNPEKDHLYLGTAAAWGLETFYHVGLETQQHALTVGAAGSGKSAHAITQLALWDGPALVIDPAAQMATVLAPGDPLAVVVDPYNMIPTAAGTASGWNPFRELRAFVQRHGKDAAVRMASIMAEGLVMPNPNVRDPHWIVSAQAVAMMAILWVAFEEPPERQNLLTFRTRITQGLHTGEDGFNDWLELMQQSTAFDGLIAARAATVAQMGEKERGGVMSTLRTSCAWIDNPSIRTSLLADGPLLEELRWDPQNPNSNKARFYIVAPASDLAGPMAGWPRLMLSMLGYICESLGPAQGKPIYTMIDEFPSLGRMSVLLTMGPKLRKFGIRLHVLAQSLSQIHAVYGEQDGEVFISEAAAVFWFPTGSAVTTDYISRILGRHTLVERLDGGTFDDGPTRHHKRELDLLDADQVRRWLDRGNIIVTRPSKPALKLKPSPYWTRLATWQYTPDPAHGERPWRVFGRRVVAWVQAWRARRLPPAPAKRLEVK